MTSLTSGTTANAIRRRIQELRVAQGLSEAALGARVGLAEECLRGVEQGQRVPTLDDLQRIADGLGVQIQDLVRRGG
jgi:transcriptional regulator with XRE-family HTH domain